MLRRSIVSVTADAEERILERSPRREQIPTSREPGLRNLSLVCAFQGDATPYIKVTKILSDVPQEDSCWQAWGKGKSGVGWRGEAIKELFRLDQRHRVCA